jgi:hypothetical protein
MKGAGNKIDTILAKNAFFNCARLFDVVYQDIIANIFM